MIQTSIGNVGMILHCAPLLLNAGWTENKDLHIQILLRRDHAYCGEFIEKIDHERVQVSKKAGTGSGVNERMDEADLHIQGGQLV